MMTSNDYSHKSIAKLICHEIVLRINEKYWHYKCLEMILKKRVKFIKLLIDNVIASGVMPCGRHVLVLPFVRNHVKSCVGILWSVGIHCVHHTINTWTSWVDIAGTKHSGVLLLPLFVIRLIVWRQADCLVFEALYWHLSIKTSFVTAI